MTAKVHPGRHPHQDHDTYHSRDQHKTGKRNSYNNGKEREAFKHRNGRNADGYGVRGPSPGPKKHAQSQHQAPKLPASFVPSQGLDMPLDPKSLLGLSGDLSLASAVAAADPVAHLRNICMAHVITALADRTIGNPALMLQHLLDFSPYDYDDLMLALAESGCSYVDILAAYIHNLRIVADDQASSQGASSEQLLGGITDKFNDLISEISKAGSATFTGNYQPSSKPPPATPPRSRNNPPPPPLNGKRPSTSDKSSAAPSIAPPEPSPRSATSGSPPANSPVRQLSSHHSSPKSPPPPMSPSPVANGLPPAPHSVPQSPNVMYHNLTGHGQVVHDAHAGLLLSGMADPSPQMGSSHPPRSVPKLRSWWSENLDDARNGENYLTNGMHGVQRHAHPPPTTNPNNSIPGFQPTPLPKEALQEDPNSPEQAQYRHMQEAASAPATQYSLPDSSSAVAAQQYSMSDNGQVSAGQQYNNQAAAAQQYAMPDSGSAAAQYMAELQAAAMNLSQMMPPSLQHAQHPHAMMMLSGSMQNSLQNSIQVQGSMPYELAASAAAAAAAADMSAMQMGDNMYGNAMDLRGMNPMLSVGSGHGVALPPNGYHSEPVAWNSIWQ